VTGGAVDFGFAPGITAQDRRARNLFQRRLNTTLVAPKSLATVRGFAGFLLSSSTVTRPIDDALIAAHANSEGWIFIPMFAKQKGGTNFETLEKALSDPAKSIAVDDAVIGHTTGDPVTHSVHFKGCNIGRAPAFLTKFREALGGNVMVTAPKHFHGIYEHTAFGTFEYMAYEFQVRNKTYFPNRAAVLSAFDAGGFAYIDGTPVPTADWPKWVPKKKVGKSVKTPLSPKLGVTLGKRKTIETEREYRVTPLKFDWSIKYSGGAPPATTAARQAAFEASVGADAGFQSTHDYPWYERLGYADVAGFFAGYTWTHSVKKNTLFTTGTRVEYTILLPITDPATGNLVFNFHPLSTSPHAAITNLNETDSDYFEQV
jgi:hypothetical protein